MTTQKSNQPKGMGSLKATVPLKTEEWFRTKSESEGVTMQSLIAPVLNAVARGDIKIECVAQGGQAIAADAHGNTKARF